MKYLFLVLFFFSTVCGATSLDSIVSGLNSTSTPLASGATFTGTAENTEAKPSVLISVNTDKDGTLYAEFSPDGTNWDSSITYGVNANVNEVHRLSTSKKYYRTRFTNSSTQNQTQIRLQTIFGHQNNLTSSLSAITDVDADAQIVKSFPEDLIMARGLFRGVSVINKFGRNTDIDQAAVNEDICDTGGVYTGFPVDNIEAVRVVSSSANDTAAGSGARTVRITGLDATWSPLSETVTLNGTSPVATTGLFRRVHTAIVLTSGSSNTAFNAGTITVSHDVTTSNVFLAIQAGTNQSNCSAYTVPVGKTAYLRKLHGTVRGSTAASADISVWVRLFGQSPRLRRPSAVSQGSELEDSIYGGLVLPEKTDVILRSTSGSAANMDVVAGYDLVQIDN